LKFIFSTKYVSGQDFIEFTLDDVRAAGTALGITIRNPPDLIYRMRSRTILPQEIQDEGFRILRNVGRGLYRLEKAESTIFDIPINTVQEALDITPLPVRRLLPENLSETDEQGLLTIVSYCKLLDHFTGLQVYRLRSHVRKSVKALGQAELDEIDVGVALRDDELPVIFPIEAKAADEPVNRVQIAGLVAFSNQYFPNMLVRPLVVKLDYKSLIHILEFNMSSEPSTVKITQSKTYKLILSEMQIRLIRETELVNL
jgi:hypothetical protein